MAKKMIVRKAFTLIEVLISVALLSFVMLGLYSALGMQKTSNKKLFDYLTRAIDSDKAIMVLYMDIMYSDGNITIRNGEFDRLCVENTGNSLYGLGRAKVCWLVAKEQNRLIRVEGNDYSLPSKSEDNIAVDKTIKNIELFEVTKVASELLVTVQKTNENPYTFLLQGIEQPRQKKEKVNKKTKTSSPKK